MKKFNLKVKEKIENFFDWVKGAELIELETCNVSEDPVRPELDIKFRTEYGRKIFGVRYKKEICAIMCFGFTNDIPKTVEELDMMTKDAHLQSTLRDRNVGKIAIAYTVWSKKKGGGKLIVKEVASNFGGFGIVVSFPVNIIRDIFDSGGRGFFCKLGGSGGFLFGFSIDSLG